MTVFPREFANRQFSSISLNLNWVIHPIEITLQQATLQPEDRPASVDRAPTYITPITDLALTRRRTEVMLMDRAPHMDTYRTTILALQEKEMAVAAA